MIEQFELNYKVVGKRNIISGKLLRPKTKGTVIRRYPSKITNKIMLDVQYENHEQDIIPEEWITIIE